MASRSRRFFVDTTPLRTSPQFRLLFAGMTVSTIGNQLTVVAAPIQVYGLTESSLAVGLLGLAQFVPLLLGSLLGGSLADTFDRRRVMLGAQAAMLCTSLGLAANAALESPHLGAIYVLTAMQAGLSGIDNPARAASVPALVGRVGVPAASALTQLVWHIGGIIGPALAGISIATLGIGATYVFDVGTFVVSLVLLLFMAPILPKRTEAEKANGRASMLHGLRFLKGRQALQGSFVIDINAMVFGMPRALFPALAVTVYGGDAATAGFLYAAPAVGAALGAVTSGWVTRIDKQGRAVLWAVLVWGASIAAFGFVPWLGVAMVLLALAGAADVVSAVSRNSILQISVPDRLRGRLSAVHIAVVTGGPRLGDAEAGAAAALLGPQASVVTGGLACMAGVGVIARLMPELGRWRISTAPDAELIAD